MGRSVKKKQSCEEVFKALMFSVLSEYTKEILEKDYVKKEQLGFSFCEDRKDVFVAISKDYVSKTYLDNIIFKIAGDMVDVKRDIEKLNNLCKAQDIVNMQFSSAMQSLSTQIKQQKEQLKLFNTPIISTPPHTEHTAAMIDELKKNANTPSPAKESTWRNNEERCEHLFKAVRGSLVLMHGIHYTKGETCFVVSVKCQGRYRDITVNTFKKEISLSFTRRNGKFEEKFFTNTTAAAAGVVAVVMYYATR